MGNFLSLIFFSWMDNSYLVSSPWLTTKKNDSVFSFLWSETSYLKNSSLTCGPLTWPWNFLLELALIDLPEMTQMPFEPTAARTTFHVLHATGIMRCQAGRQAGGSIQKRFRSGRDKLRCEDRRVTGHAGFSASGPHSLWTCLKLLVYPLRAPTSEGKRYWSGPIKPSIIEGCHNFCKMEKIYEWIEFYFLVDRRIRS